MTRDVETSIDLVGHNIKDEDLDVKVMETALFDHKAQVCKDPNL